MGRRLGVSLFVVCGLLSWGLAAASPAGADVPMISYTFGSPPTTISVPATCARTGITTLGTPSVSNVAEPPATPSPAAQPDGYDCASQLAVFMIAEAHGDYGSINAVEALASLLFTGHPHLTSVYEVFLNNVQTSMDLLKTLGDDELLGNPNLGTVGCQLTTEFLTLACPDIGEGTYQWGTDTIDYEGFLSQGGGTTYGNVFLINGANDGHWVDPYTNSDARILHHEQVHSQQWAVNGLSMEQLYIIQDANGMSEAIQKNANPLGSPSWWAFQWWCNNAYEIQAGLADGGYLDPNNPMHCTYHTPYW